MRSPKMMKLAGGLAASLLLGQLLLRWASLAAAPLDFDVGPFMGDYLSGFKESEERPPVTFRWTGPRASIHLPLNARRAGSATLYLRYARFVDAAARVRVYVGGRPAASFSARPGRFRTRPISVVLPEGPLGIDIVIEDPHPSHLGIAVDWIRIEGARWRFPLSALALRLAVGGVFLVCCLAGFTLPAALLAALGLGLAQALWTAFEPFAVAHVGAKIYLVAGALAASLAVAVRHRKQGRWLVLIFLAGYLLKGAGVFHPRYFYADVRQHRRYVFAFAQAAGSIPERGLAAQYKMGTAYPRHVGSKVYAFPYSPVFFIPFTWLPRRPHLVEDALKHVSLVAAAAEVLGVAWLGTLVFGEATGVLAALLAAFLPPMTSRLLIAYYPTIAAHLLDTLAIAAATALAARPESLRRLGAFGALSFASFLSYVSSLFNLSAFAGFVALLHRKLTGRVLAVTAVAALATIALLYRRFTAAFFTEILPSLLSPLSAAGPSASVMGVGPAGLTAAFSRLVQFYGYGYLALAVAGVVVARRRLEPQRWRPLFAYLLSLLLLLGLRAGSGLFKDLKEILYAGPLIAVASAGALSALAARGRWEKRAVLLIVCGLVGFGLWKYGGYLSAHTALFGLGELG